jgi:hypothetical protein
MQSSVRSSADSKSKTSGAIQVSIVPPHCIDGIDCRGARRAHRDDSEAGQLQL